MGYLHLYTGNGKGKTTCAVGLAVRAAGAGKRVAFLQFDKGFEGRNEHYHERGILRSIPQIELEFFGMERIQPDGKFRFANSDDDFKQATTGLKRAVELVRSGKHFLVICDEAITCVSTKLYSEADLMGLVDAFKQDPKCELVLTGRGAFPALIEAADLVTEMALVKHYFYQGVESREGIEF